MIGEFEAVVLAAGRSSRAGAFKPALDCGGVPLVTRVVRSFARVCRRVWVVTGFRGDEVAALVAGEPGVSVVPNTQWERGMFSSVQAGVSRVSTGRFFVTPGDLPLISPAVVRTLAAVSGSLVVPLWATRTGHPVLLDPLWAERILAADPLSDLRTVLDGHPRVEVPMPDDGVLRDIDTCEDYDGLRTRWGRLE